MFLFMEHREISSESKSKEILKLLLFILLLVLLLCIFGEKIARVFGKLDLKYDVLCW